MQNTNKLLLVLSIMLACLNSSTARKIHPNKWQTSITIVPIKIVQLDSSKTSITTTKTLNDKLKFGPGSIRNPFNINGVNYYEINIVDISYENPKLKNSADIYNTADEGFVWYAKESDINDEDVTRYWERAQFKPFVEFGLLYLPFKFRPGLKDNNLNKARDLTSEVNLGATMNIGFNSNVRVIKNLNIPFNISLFTDKVNKYNSYDGIDKEENLTGLSFATGLVFNVKNGLQVGGLIGVDQAMGQSGERWIYDGRPWFSFGIGYKFIRPESTDKNIN